MKCEGRPPRFRNDPARVDHGLAGMFEIYRYASPDDGLNLPQSPIGPIWVANIGTRR